MKIPLIVFPTEVRIAASESLPFLIDCARMRGQQYLAEMWNFICPNLIKAIEVEPEPSVLPEHLNSMSKVGWTTARRTNERMNEWMFNDTPARKADRLLGVRTKERMNEWMFNDTPARKADRLLGVRTKERRKEMFYLTTHSTYFIYGYMASDIWLRTILIVRKENRCRHIGYSLGLAARVLLYAPSHRQDSTYHGLCYTSRVALVGTRNPKEWYYSAKMSLKF